MVADSRIGRSLRRALGSVALFFLATSFPLISLATEKYASTFFGVVILTFWFMRELTYCLRIFMLRKASPIWVMDLIMQRCDWLWSLHFSRDKILQYYDHLHLQGEWTSTLCVIRHVIPHKISDLQNAFPVKTVSLNKSSHT